jgi:hypothetical protein
MMFCFRFSMMWDVNTYVRVSASARARAHTHTHTLDLYTKCLFMREWEVPGRTFQCHVFFEPLDFLVVKDVWRGVLNFLEPHICESVEHG